ncbi:hypothetical protein BACCAP_02012 [Pseudoflavonifractor capillosus ATCC 29799]|uniref:Uncharacterized protein n=1 Tax=Pseudoflavonifractor capillosus ATCC 29799 TaxID=411467 RepID=A6NUX8_9FIRM|nr:hypothetical protein BACCAP_02012 [Pseudoflavonifractor capillosus ATCC 29799]
MRGVYCTVSERKCQIKLSRVRADMIVTIEIYVFGLYNIKVKD